MKEGQAKWMKLFLLGIATQPPSEDGTCKQRLRSETDEFAPRSSVKSRDLLAERVDMTGLSNASEKHKYALTMSG